MTTTPRILLTLALACTLGACKSESGSVDSGVTPDKTGSELTPDEQTQLCESVEDYERASISDAEAKRYACTTAAVTATLFTDGDAAACKILLDGCLQQEPMPATPTACMLAISDWPSCMATVAELEACYTDLVDGEVAAFESLSCDRIEEYKTSEPGEPMQTESCSRAEAKCPGAGSGRVKPAPMP